MSKIGKIIGSVLLIGATTVATPKCTPVMPVIIGNNLDKPVTVNVTQQTPAGGCCAAGGVPYAGYNSGTVYLNSSPPVMPYNYGFGVPFYYSGGGGW